MATFRVTLGYREAIYGTTWRISNVLAAADANAARDKANTWNTDYLGVCAADVHLDFCKVTVDPKKGLLHVAVEFPVSGFDDDHGTGLGDLTMTGSYLLWRGQSHPLGGTSHWRLHGINSNLLDGPDKWNVDAAALVGLNAANLVYFQKYRPFATGAPSEEHPKKRNYAVVDPPDDFPAGEFDPCVYFTKTGRSFELPGQQRR